MDAPTCRLCGAPLPASAADGTVRCVNCGLFAADLDGRGYGRVAAGLAGVYVITALLVLLARS